MNTYHIEPEFGNSVAWEKAWKPIRDVVVEACDETGLKFESDMHKADIKFVAHATKKTAPWGDFFYKVNHLPQLYSIDSHGWGMTHSGVFSDHWKSVNPVLARKFCEEQARKFMTTGVSNQPQPPPRTSFPERNYILATLQMPGDSVIVQNSDVTVEQFLEMCVEWGPEKVAVKNHPGNTPERFPEFHKRITELAEQKKIRLVNGNIHTLIFFSKGVVTINSGTGFEALVHGRPVALIGRADYQQHCFQTWNIKEIDALFDAYNEPMKTRAYQFVWDYVFRCCFWLSGDPNGIGRAKRFVMDQIQAKADKSHLGGHCNLTHIDLGALAYLKEKCGILSMLDIGCGPAGMSQVAKSIGVFYSGIDGDASIAAKYYDVIIHDYHHGPCNLGVSIHDLAWSVEFLEHIEERFLSNVIPNFQSCRWVVITHALPGKGGYHHVNCQDSDYWIRFFEQNGFEFRPEETEAVRKASTMKREFMRETGLVFKRK